MTIMFGFLPKVIKRVRLSLEPATITLKHYIY